LWVTKGGLGGAGVVSNSFNRAPTPVMVCIFFGFGGRRKGMGGRASNICLMSVGVSYGQEASAR
jgi:hypothetical protein